MPIKRVRRSRPKKTYSKKKVPTNKQLAGRIKRIEHEVELKHDDGFANNQSFDLAGLLYGPMPIAQQSSEITRIGNEVVAKYANIRFFINTNAAVPVNRMRFIAFIDRQSNGTLPTLLASINPTLALLDDLTVTDTTLAFFNENTKERYGILKDKIWVSNQIVTGVGMQLYYDYKFNLHNMKVKYGDGTLVATNLVSKQIYYCWISSSATASATKPAVFLAHRWLYADP